MSGARRFLVGVMIGLGWIQAPAAVPEAVVADPTTWPAEVVVLTGTKAEVLKQDQPAGVMLLGVGKKLAVTKVAADTVTGRAGGVVVRVPVDKTDFLQRIGTVAPVASAEPAAEAVEPPAAPVTPRAAAGASSVMQRRLSGKVVRLAGSALQPAGDDTLAGVKYYALYYSASWCGPCRQFTPSLVSAYRQLKAAHPEFEVVFISADNSGGEMRDYMRADKMPWLALKYDLREKNPELMRYSGPGIPCLVLVDASGRVLADTYEGDDYVGPQKVLREATRLLQRGG